MASQFVIFQRPYLKLQNGKMPVKLHYNDYNDIKLQSFQIHSTTITEISNLQD